MPYSTRCEIWTLSAWLCANFATESNINRDNFVLMHHRPLDGSSFKPKLVKPSWSSSHRPCPNHRTSQATSKGCLCDLCDLPCEFCSTLITHRSWPADPVDNKGGTLLGQLTKHEKHERMTQNALPENPGHALSRLNTSICTHGNVFINLGCIVGQLLSKIFSLSQYLVQPALATSTGAASTPW